MHINPRCDENEDVTMRRIGTGTLSLALSAVILFFGGLNATNAQQTARSTAEGVFTEEQAKRGAAAYNAHCAGCHGADLRSTDREVSNLTDESFKRWIGKTIAEIFEVTRDTMPPREERSLSDQMYLDMVTFILRFNKVPAGSQDLKPDLQTLKQIKIGDPG
jgi:mono/diheme cytochrome c family protein